MDRTAIEAWKIRLAGVESFSPGEVKMLLDEFERIYDEALVKDKKIRDLEGLVAVKEQQLGIKIQMAEEVADPDLPPAPAAGRRSTLTQSDVDKLRIELMRVRSTQETRDQQVVSLCAIVKKAISILPAAEGKVLEREMHELFD